MKKYKFDADLIEGVIMSRPNRFIMMVKLGGKIVECHCPVTGKIGNIEFNNISCLLSESNNKSRRTKYTVEAISLDNPSKKNKSWVGINQNKINKYVEFFLKNGGLYDIVGIPEKVQREVKLLDSRIDFLVDDMFVEVKMPLIAFPGGQQNSTLSKFNSFDRLIKHFTDLSSNPKAVVLLCFLYNADIFSPPKTNQSNNRVRQVADKAIKDGVAMWQANFSINESGVCLVKHFKLRI